MPNIFNIYLDFTSNYVGIPKAVIMVVMVLAGDWIIRKLPPLLYEKLEDNPKNKFINFLLFDVLRMRSPKLYD